MRAPCVLGIDASLTSTGLCAIPLDWDLDWQRLRCHTIPRSLTKTASERERIERMQSIAVEVRCFAVQVHATAVWIEDLPSGRAFNIPQLAELRGFIRAELARDLQLRLFVGRANQSTIRKLLLGKLPPSDRKKAVATMLDCMTAECVIQPFEDGDQKDAFVVANWGLSELAAPCIALPAPPPVARARKAAA
jgi:Holliday junction resolvasome RuvABC endonuclease subunit